MNNTSFDINKITDTQNLAQNRGTSTYASEWAVQQNSGIFEIISRLIETTKPSRILEIGTAMGGLPCFLNHICDSINLPCKILSYDIIEYSWYHYIRDLGIDVRVENIFLDNYTRVKEEVSQFIQQEGRTLVLCDGGSKIDEFKALSGFLKPDDIIMAHDYAPSADYFNDHMYLKIWNWHEIQDSDVEECCKEYDLQPFNQEEFIQVAWMCRIKK